ncbi:MAG: putative RNA-binding protein 25, partial [Paramarteilia canceri]
SSVNIMNPNISHMATMFPFKPQSSNKKSPADQETTFFLGNIEPAAPDEMIIRMLRSCGKMVEWKRASGSHGTMQPFGFVKFEDFESALRASRTMHGIIVGKKALQVKLGKDVKQKLDDYKKLKRKSALEMGYTVMPDQTKIDNADDEEIAYLTAEEVQFDSGTSLKLDRISKEYDDYFRIPELQQSVAESFLRSTIAKSTQGQLKQFAEEEKMKKDTFKIKSDEAKNKLTLKSSLFKDEADQVSDDSSEHDDIISGSLRSAAKASLMLPSSKTYNDELNNLEEERKNFIKSLRERAKQYAQFLKKFEARERRQQRAYIYENNAIEDWKINYTMDKKHYYSRRFAFKLSEYEEEMKNDAELLSQKDEIKNSKFYQKFTNILSYIKSEITNKNKKINEPESAIDSESLYELQSPDENGHLPNENFKPVDKISENQTISEADRNTNINKGLQIKIQPKSHSEMHRLAKEFFGIEKYVSIFGEIMVGEDENNDPDSQYIFKKKQKLEPINFEAEKIKEQKKEKIFSIIESIPTEDDDLFAYAIEWNKIEEKDVWKEVQSWISQKIEDYLGEKEETLLEFITSNLKNRVDPRKLAEDIAAVFEEEAATLTAKLWRLLIFLQKYYSN